MSDIEAAARALLTNGAGREFKYLVLRDTPGNLPGEGGSYSMAGLVSTLRSALAHATRGEGECEDCDAGHHAFRIDRDAGGRVFHDLPNGQIIQCQKTSRAYASPTPPPATGMKCWRDVEGTLPARRDGDKVARIDPETAIPATGKPWCRLCCGPHIGSDHVSTPYAAHPPATGEAKCPRCHRVRDDDSGCVHRFHNEQPATGEAGTRGEPFGGYERERAAFDAWWATVADTAGVPLNEVEERKARLLAWQAFYCRALPEAREGGRG